MKTRNARHVATLGILLCATTMVQAETPDEGRYIMMVYSDMAHGRAVLNGSPGELIEKLARDKSGKTYTLEENVNLCVAYTQAKRVADATDACDDAVAASTKKTQRARRSTSPMFNPVRQARSVQAVTLSNRGVLHALTGELDEARELFEAAIELDANKKQIGANLSLLEEDLTAAR